MTWQQPYAGQQGFGGGAYPGMGGPYPGGPYPGGFPAQPTGFYPTPQPGYGGYPGGYPAGQPDFNMPPDVEIGGAPKNDVPGAEGMDFTEKTIRRGFIRKVYSILMVQLVVTIGIIAAFWHPEVKMFVRQRPSLMFVAFGFTLVLMIAMACCESVRRKSPTNYICLALFTLAQGFLMGVIASRYQTSSVLLAAGITAFICLSLTIFSFQTKFDMTAKNGILFVCMIVFMLFGFLMIFLGRAIPMLHIVYSCLGALLFSFYLVYDTQMMMGGNHKYSISPEEYVFAALSLYLDIVQIFLYILRIVGSMSGD